MTLDDLEPRIRPLVEALNQTGLLRTFSSCEGHYEPHEQTLVDRNFAFVKFVPADGITEQAVESFLGVLLARFKARHGLMPIHLIGYKLFTPLDEEAVERSFVLELRPFNRFDPPATKRSDTDRAIERLVRLVQ
ncbi:hypothetical protein BN8_00910 [Fibrisoma limi BUZ 3]|uniref:Uncharacterized protein n=1 Tax=Fibrisoma limi BUZ 3 TaxID=1185876 RepID=I2GDH7_9BACT|nr:hypothetical protein [Fibrisoma limi]CCH51951.1 hypothetical protein BN8_00910 [Fibrisoma limi BUZ 3]